MNRRTSFATLFLLSGAVALGGACGDDDGGGTGAGGSGAGGPGGRPNETGAACEVPADCYTDVADDELQGDALCLDRVRGGYCTHECADDDDCCAAEGECDSGIDQVCSPFESTNTMMCFLACEGSDIGDRDDQEYCQAEAGKDFICRSSGGGSNNRKICVPGDCGVGADCGSADDCTGDLECTLDLLGGYCSKTGCELNADCPEGSLCVDHSDGSSYCMKSCEAETDCTFCRGADVFATCSDEVTFMEADTTGSVCILE